MYIGTSLSGGGQTLSEKGTHQWLVTGKAYLAYKEIAISNDDPGEQRGSIFQINVQSCVLFINKNTITAQRKHQKLSSLCQELSKQ